MNDLVQLDFYATIPEKDAIVLRESEGKIIAIARNAVIDIGLELIMAKKLAGHGSFIRWVEEKMSFTVRTAQKYMSVADAFEANTNLDSHLEPNILYELAAPKNKDIRNDIIEQIQSGEIEPTYKSVKQEAQLQHAITDEEIAHHPSMISAIDKLKAAKREVAQALQAKRDLEAEVEQLQDLVDAANRMMHAAEVFATKMDKMSILPKTIVYEISAPKNRDVADQVIEGLEKGEIAPTQKAVDEAIAKAKAEETARIEAEQKRNRQSTSCQLATPTNL